MQRSVLLFGNHAPPFGGVPMHVEYLATYLAGLGWDVQVLSVAGLRRGTERISGYTVYRPGKGERVAMLVPSAAMARRALRFRSLAVESPRQFLGCHTLAGLIRQIAARHKTQVICAYHLFSAGLASAWASEELGIPLITTVLGEIYSQTDQYRRRLAEVQYVAQRSVKLLSPSRHCANSYQLLGLPVDVEVVYYGIDIQKFHPENDASAVRRRLGIDEQDEIVLFVGRMVREMGLGTLLASVPEVLARRPRSRFVLAGAKGDLLESAQAVREQYPKHVFLAPDVSPDEVDKYYAASTVCVAPSTNARACLGLAIAEAMASGKPVIACRVGGTAEVVVDGESGILVPPNESRELAAAIASLLDDPERCRRMGLLGRELAVTRFNKDATNRTMARIIEEAAA